MRHVREQRKLLRVGVDLPIDAGTCGRFVHAGYQRCVHCTRRRWWLLKQAFNAAADAPSAPQSLAAIAFLIAVNSAAAVP